MAKHTQNLPRRIEAQPDYEALRRENDELKQQLGMVRDWVVKGVNRDTADRLAAAEHENEELRRQNINLRLSLSALPFEIGTPGLMDNLPVTTDNKTLQTAIGVALFYRDSKAVEIHTSAPLFGLFPGTMEQARNVITSQIQWIINCAPTPDDLSGDPLFGVDAAQSFEIFAGLAKLRQVLGSGDVYNSQLSATFDEYWQLVSDMPGAPDKTDARKSFRIKAQRTYEHWANRVHFIDESQQPI